MATVDPYQQLYDPNNGNGVWNPQAPNYDPASGGYTTPTPKLEPLPVQQTTPGYDYGKLQSWRDLNRAKGIRVDETDANVFNDRDFQNWQTGSAVPNQFDDPYTNQLESIAKSQMGQVRSNPGLDSLMQFLNQRFSELSTTPGYSLGEQALLRTQALEPIEADRAASSRRSLERTAARGMLPTSGLAELDLRDIDRAADQRRTVAGRDLAIAGLNRRDADLGQALNIGQLLGLQIPGQQRSEELGLSNLLYQLPRTAMQDALSVVNGSPSSSDAFSQALQLLQQNRYQQQVNDQRNAAIWGQLGSVLAGLFNG